MPSAQELISQAIALRDGSLARVEPALTGIPEHPPKNVISIAEDVLTPEEIKITSYDAPELVKLLRDKKLSSETVTRAFLRRAALAQRLVCHSLSQITRDKSPDLYLPLNNRSTVLPNSCPKEL